MRLREDAGHPEHLEDLLAVDRVTCRQAYPRIIKRLLRTTEEEIFVLDRHRLVDVEAWVFRDGLDLLLLQPLDDIGLAVQKGERSRRRVANEMILDTWNLGRTEEVVRIRGQDRRIALLLDIFIRPSTVHARRQLRLVGNVLGRQDREKGRKIIIECCRIALRLGVDMAWIINDHVDTAQGRITMRPAA